MSAGKPDVMDSVSRPGPAPEPVIAALAAVYRRAIERYGEVKEGSPATACDNDAVNTKGDSYDK